MQSPVKILHIGRAVKEFAKYCTGQSRALTSGYEEEIIKKREAPQKTIIITDKGLNFLAEFRRMREFTETFGL